MGALRKIRRAAGIGQGIRHWLSSSQGVFGLLADLVNQPGNGSSNIKIKLASTHVPATYGNWASGQNYGVGEIRAYPSGSPLLWKVVNAISSAPANTTPPYSVTNGVVSFNSDWELDIAFDMIQDSGDGTNYFRTTLQKSVDGFIRLNNFQYGTYTTTQFNRAASNYETTGGLITTSASSIASNTAVPSSKSFTAGTGLSQFFASTTLNASYSNTFSIPTTHPTLSNHTIGAGLDVSEGSTLTFYGDASNFFVFVVTLYNSETGVATGFSTMHLGSGSFSTWTIKKEVLLYFKWQGGAVDFYALLQTYDSGTGAATANMIASANPAGALTNWNISYGKRPTAPTASQGTNYNAGGQNLAVWHFGTFFGTALAHGSVKSTAGTGWLYIYLSGPDSPANVTIDTYNGSTVTNQSTAVWSNLTFGYHRFVAISTTSPSGSSSNTVPWIYASTNTANILSYVEQINYDLFTSSVDIGLQDPQSAGELAWRFKLNGSAHTTQWFPYHGTVTDRSDSRIFTVDGVVIDTETLSSVTNPYLYKYQSFSVAKITQEGAVTHPQDAGDFADYASVHTLNRYGIDWDISMTWLKSALIETGYNNMVSLAQTWFNKIKSEDGVYMNRPADNTSVNMANDFKNQQSYLFYSTSGSADLKDLVLALYWPDITNWRAGLSGAGTSFVQDFSGSSGAKFYPFAYTSYTTTIGETSRIRGRMYLGKWTDANSNL